MTIKRMANPSENSPARLHRGFSPYHRGFSPDHRDLILSSWARARGCEGEGSKNLRAACTLRDKQPLAFFKLCSFLAPSALRRHSILEEETFSGVTLNTTLHGTGPFIRAAAWEAATAGCRAPKRWIVMRPDFWEFTQSAARMPTGGQVEYPIKCYEGSGGRVFENS